MNKLLVRALVILTKYQYPINALFISLWVISVIFVLAEVFIHPGIISSHLLIDPTLLAYTTIILGFFCINPRSLVQSSAGAFLILSIILFFLFLFFHFFEAADISNYPNYTYSTYKIYFPDILLLIDLVSILLAVIIANRILEIEIKRGVIRLHIKKVNHQIKVLFFPQKPSSLQILFLLLLLPIIFVNYQSIYSYNLTKRLSFMVKHPFASNQEKLAQELDTGIYHNRFFEFTNFIKALTPEHSKILLPPQESPWQEFGNRGFMRYFLYPRTLVNGKANIPPENFSDYDYVIIVLGVNDADIQKSNLSWPEFAIPGKVIYFLGNDNKVLSQPGPFDPQKSYPSRFGLIKL